MRRIRRIGNFIWNDSKTVAKWLVIGTAILHLVFVPIHVSALLKLGNEICGIYMFLFILFGLVSLFNAVRLKDFTRKTFVFNVITIIITIVFGVMLTLVYFEALRIQPKLETMLVYKAIALSIVIMLVYFSAIMLFIREALKKQ